MSLRTRQPIFDNSERVFAPISAVRAGCELRISEKIKTASDSAEVMQVVREIRAIRSPKQFHTRLFSYGFHGLRGEHQAGSSVKTRRGRAEDGHQELKKRRRPRTLPGRTRRLRKLRAFGAARSLKRPLAGNSFLRQQPLGHASRAAFFSKRRIDFSPLWSSVVSAAVPVLSAAICVSLGSLGFRRSVVLSTHDTLPFPD